MQGIIEEGNNMASPTCKWMMQALCKGIIGHSFKSHQEELENKYF